MPDGLCYYIGWYLYGVPEPIHAMKGFAHLDDAKQCAAELPQLNKDIDQIWVYDNNDTSWYEWRRPPLTKNG